MTSSLILNDLTNVCSVKIVFAMVNAVFAIVCYCCVCRNVSPLVVNHRCTFLSSPSQTMRRKARKSKANERRGTWRPYSSGQEDLFNWVKQMQSLWLCIISHKLFAKDFEETTKKNQMAIELSEHLFRYMANYGNMMAK